MRTTKLLGDKTLMRSCILCKFWGSSKTISGHKLAAMLKMPPPKDSSETIWYIGLKFSGITEINSYSLSIFRNFNLLTSSDNDKPTLMRQKCKQGFVYTLKGKLPKLWKWPPKGVRNANDERCSRTLKLTAKYTPIHS